MSAVSKVLDRVAGVKSIGKGRWMAKCPAHEDAGPSLSIREMEDGRVLLNDFGGCATSDVIAAIGLSFTDLFDKALEHHLPPIRGGFNARELLELNAHEATVAAMLADKAAAGTLTPADAQRLVQAAARLGKAQDLANGR
jgi:hypothetical protein